MVFDRRYYDESKIEQAEMEAAVEAELTSMSPKERAERDHRMDQRFQELLDAMDQQLKTEKRAPSPDGTQRFIKRVASANRLAQATHMNLHAQTRDSIGIIRLVGEQLILSSIWDRGERDILGKMIQAAEDFWVDMIELNGEKVLQFEFKFDLS